jgi:hypothetical protein
VKSPRVSIAWVMLGVAIVAFDCSILGAILRGHTLLNPVCGLDMGLVPIGTALGLALGDMALRQGGGLRPFSVGFTAVGLVTALVYVTCCWVVPDLMAVPDDYYVNQVEPRFMNPDSLGPYLISLLIRGIILALLPLFLALAGGLLAHRFVRRRGRPSAPPPTI